MVLAALAAPALAGCADSTQLRNDRAELSARRDVASRERQRVTQRNPQVRVAEATRVSDARSTAIVVELRSSAAAPLTDVPITVGVRRRDGRRTPLNDRPGLDWFQTHVAAIPARGTATWVFRTRRPVPAGRPFAVAGVLPEPALSAAGSLPAVRVAPQPATVPGVARVRVTNASKVPQDALQVYAVRRRGGRSVAAGRTAVARLAPGRKATVTMRLTGARSGGTLDVGALPTIFR